jgi:APA family basic amino acid/polyamine antiporter
MGHTLGGPVLGHWLFLGSVASQAVIFLAYLLWWSRLVWVMAEDGHLPGFLRARHPRYDTPHRALFAYAIIYSALAALPFEDLLVADVWITGASNLVLQFSLLRSRTPEDGAAGFRVPGGRVGLWLNVALPAATWALLLVFTARDHFLLGAGSLLVAPLAWLATRALRRRRAP